MSRHIFSTASRRYSILLSVLITFGLMQRSNEITAIKATGISIYRIIVPVLLASAIAGDRVSFSSTSFICRMPTSGRTRCAT